MSRPISGYGVWFQDDLTQIKITAMTVEHLKNAIDMCERNHIWRCKEEALFPHQPIALKATDMKEYSDYPVEKRWPVVAELKAELERRKKYA